MTTYIPSLLALQTTKADDSTVVHNTGTETVNGVKTFTSTIQGNISGTAGGGAPPTGAAGGDLSSSYPNPMVSKINGVSLGTTTATAGNLLIGSGTQWVTNAMSGDAAINSSGALTLTTVNSSPATYGSATQVPVFVVNAKGLVTSVTNTTISGTSPGGSAGGSLTGTYPNPTIANLAVTNAMIAANTIDLTAKVTGILPSSNGGTGQDSSAWSQGDLVYISATGTWNHLAKNTTASRYLSNSGSSNNPSWAQVDLTNGVTGILPAANGGTANGFTAFSGPASSAKTFTLPNATCTILTTNAAVTEIQGGTNQTTYTTGDTLYASAANTLSKLSGNTTTAKQYLSQTGTGSASQAPAWTTIAGADITGAALTVSNDTNVTLTLGGTPATSLLRAASITAGWTGTLGAARGGTNVDSSAWAQGDIVYISATGTWDHLAKNTTATRYLANTGTTNNPAWDQINLANGVTGRLPFANLTQGSALSVLGVTGNATADNASIAAGSDNQVLRRSGTALSFGAVNIASSSAVTGTLPNANTTATSTYNTASSIVSRDSNGAFGATGFGIGVSAPTSRALLEVNGTLTGTDGNLNGIVFVDAVNSPSTNSTYTVSLYVYPQPSPIISTTITNSIGLYVDSGSVAGAGSITNGYSLFVLNAGAGTNKYCAYFAGNVGIGTLTPGSRLEVSGGDLTVTSGFSIVNTAGKTVKIKQGSNACAGTGAVMVGGAVTVNTNAVATGDIILTCRTATGGTPGLSSPVVTIVNGSSFTLTSSNALDTSTYSWVIIKAA